MRTDIRSARPRLLRLGNALLLLAIRPSLSLWTSSNDGKGWSKEINLAAAHNQALPDDSKLRFCREFGSRSHKCGPLPNRSVAHPFLLAAFHSKSIGEQ